MRSDGGFFRRAAGLILVIGGFGLFAVLGLIFAIGAAGGGIPTIEFMGFLALSLAVTGPWIWLGLDLLWLRWMQSPGVERVFWRGFVAIPSVALPIVLLVSVASIPADARWREIVHTISGVCLMVLLSSLLAWGVAWLDGGGFGRGVDRGKAGAGRE